MQEELDWEIYVRYGLIGADENLLAPEEVVPELHFGERAFEIALARRIERGQTQSTWFERHGAVPTTEIPNHWPAAYRQVVAARIEAIERVQHVGLVERPEFKRRWASEDWESLEKGALRSWLLDRMEARPLWFESLASGAEQPRIRTLDELTDMLSHDEDFLSVAKRYSPRTELRAVIVTLLADEHVPFISALRYRPSGLIKRAMWQRVWELQRKEDAAPDESRRQKLQDAIPVPPKYTSADFYRPSYWSVRGKLDVPNERFISYSTNPAAPKALGWGGWDHREQAHALYVHVANLSQTESKVNENVIPLLAGLLELQGWLDQWHQTYDPIYGKESSVFFAEFRRGIQQQYGMTDDDLRSWRPPAPQRGRPRKNT